MPAISVRTSAAPASRREGRGYSRKERGALKLSRTDALATLWSMRVLIALALALSSARAEVSLLRVPDEGIQPQAVVDQSGTIHLVYFKGAVRAGDLFYVHKGAKDAEFSKSLPVNSKSSSAIAVGTIRGAQIALGKNRRIHVAWNSEDGKAMLFTRLNDSRDGFEP